MLKIDHLSASYKTIDGNVHVVKDVDFEIRDNEVFGIAGESGCGKSTLLKTLYDIIEFPLEIDSGKVNLSGTKNGQDFRFESGQIRSMALTMKERDFVHTAWFSGEGTLQTVVTEILPFTLTWALSNFMNATLSAIASESGLAVLGLSPGNLVSLGNMIQWARNYNAIMMGRWNWILPPILGTIILFVGLFMLITGYNDYTAMKRGR